MAEGLSPLIGSWTLPNLIQTNVSHHLWFRWFHCRLVAAFTLLAVTGLLPTGRGRWWLAAASCLPQLVMGMSMGAGSAANGLDARLGRHCKLLLQAALVLLVIGMATLNDQPFTTLLQLVFGSTMLLGLIGVSPHCGSRPSPLFSWLANASSWMYPVHPPLVMMAQLSGRPWAMPADLKFLVVMALVLPVNYRRGARHTVFGRDLNRPRGTTSTARLASASMPSAP